MKPLTFSLGTGGTANLDISADAAAMRVALSGKIADTAVGPLLQAVQGKRPVDGTANLDLDTLAFTGSSPKEIRSTLSGKGLLTVRGIVLNDVSILPKDAPAALGSPLAHFEQLSVPFTATNGLVNVAPARLTSPSLNATGQGVARLPQETADFTADIKLLAITIPVYISGPFNALSYGFDAKRAVGNLVKQPGELLDSAKNLLRGRGTSKTASPKVGAAKKPAEAPGKGLKGLFR